MDWKECCSARIVKEVSVDPELISALRKSSTNKQASQEQLPLTSITAAAKLSLAYDSLRELLEALALYQGYKIYNHECYTAFLKEILKRSEWGDQFDEIRRVRNAANYYGKEMSMEETRLLIAEIKRLRKLVGNW